MPDQDKEINGIFCDSILEPLFYCQISAAVDIVSGQYNFLREPLSLISVENGK